MIHFLMMLPAISGAQGNFEQDADPVESSQNITQEAEEGVVPVADVRSIFTASDYPSAALREEAQGTVRARLTVAPDGSVSNCEVVESSGHELLDTTTCRIMSERAQFEPFEAGAKLYTTPPVTWAISTPSGGEFTELRQMTDLFLVDYAADGSIADCAGYGVFGADNSVVVECSYEREYAEILQTQFGTDFDLDDGIYLGGQVVSAASLDVTYWPLLVEEGDDILSSLAIRVLWTGTHWTNCRIEEGLVSGGGQCLAFANAIGAVCAEPEETGCEGDYVIRQFFIRKAGLDASIFERKQPTPEPGDTFVID